MPKTYKYSTISGAAAVTFILYFLASVIFDITEKEKAIQHATLFTTILASFLFFKNFRDELKKSLSIIPKKQALELIFCFFIIFSYQAFTTETYKANTNNKLELNQSLGIFITSTLIISPIVEEILFREIIFRNYIEKSRFKIFGLFAFSIIFSLLHSSESFYLILLLSISLYSIRITTNSLAICIIVHSAWNLLFIYTWLIGS